MKKNKHLIIISIITMILIFGVAATCNLCGTPITIGETEETEDKEINEHSKDKENADEDYDKEDTTTSQDQSETVDTPEDTTDQSVVEDDSQISDDASDNGEQEQDPPQDNGEGQDGNQQDQVSINRGMPALVDEYSGSVPLNVKDGSFGSTDLQRLVIGEYDSKDWISQAFLTFTNDKLVLENALITDATLFIDFIAFNGNTGRYTNISIGAVDWGDGPPGSYAFEQPVNKVIEVYPSSLHDDITCSSSALNDEIQRLIDNNRLIQFKIYFTGGPSNNNDGNAEYIEYSKAGTNLFVHYIAR